MKTFLRQRLGLILKVAVSVAILGCLGRKLNWIKLGAIAGAADPLFVLLAAGLLLPTFLLGAWRWQWLLRAQGIPLAFGPALQLSLIGQFFNAFLLGVTGGDVVKIYYATKAVPERRSAAGMSVVVDRIVGLLALLVIGTVLTAWYLPLLSASHGTRLALAAFYAAVAGGAAFSLVALTLPRWGNHPRVHRLLEYLPKAGLWQKFHAVVLGFMAERGVLGRCLGLSLLIHGFNFLANYTLAWGLGMRLEFGEFISWQPVVIFLMAVPISFSGLGVREMLVVLFLALFGVDKEHALAFSLEWYGLSLVWSLIGGAVYLSYRTPKVNAATGSL